MFIIDFDDTLFNTQKFKQEMVSSLVDLGVSEEIFWQTYSEARILDNGHFSYSFERHANILEKHGFDNKQVLKNLNLVKIKDFLFPDTIDFLESLKNLKQELYLLSLGDENFQRLKVDECNIEKYFKGIFFRGRDKEIFVKEILEVQEDNNNFFINDKIEESKKIQQDFPELKIILKQVSNIKEDEYKSSGIIYFQTLTEIKEYVTNKF